MKPPTFDTRLIEKDAAPPGSRNGLQHAGGPAAIHHDSQDYVELKHRLHRRLLERINLERLAGIDAPRMRGEVLVAVATLVTEEEPSIGGPDRDRIIEEILNEVFGLGPLEPLLQDPEITDILVTTPLKVYIERSGKLEKTPVRFKDNAHLQRIIEKIVSRVGRRIDESSPMVDARLPDGSRVNAVIPPVAVDGPLLSIRRFAKDPYTAEDLVAFGTLTQDMMDLLAACVKARLNVLICGGTGSGKTTLLNVLSAFVGDDERIVTIEDTAELQLKQDNVARMETRPPNIEGSGAIKQRQLLINSLRMRPDRIIVGEVRGDEILEMLQAMNTGHDGSLATIHANNCRDSLRRMEMMVNLANPNVSLAATREQVAAAIDVFVHLARLSDGTRRVMQITEALGIEDGDIALQDIFIFEKVGISPDKRVQGRFHATGIQPTFLHALRRCELFLPDSLFHSVVEV